MPAVIVCITVAMLLIALFRVPEFFRELQNNVAFGTFTLDAFRNFEPVGLIFNPLTPVILPERPSRILHIVGAILLVVTARRFT